MRALNEVDSKDFLLILDLVSFDEQLFRKEFKKTLDWIPKHEHAIIADWLIRNGHSSRFPDLGGLIECNS